MKIALSAVFCTKKKRNPLKISLFFLAISISVKFGRSQEKKGLIGEIPPHIFRQLHVFRVALPRNVYPSCMKKPLPILGGFILYSFYPICMIEIRCRHRTTSLWLLASGSFSMSALFYSNLFSSLPAFPGKIFFATI